MLQFGIDDHECDNEVGSNSVAVCVVYHKAVGSSTREKRSPVAKRRSSRNPMMPTGIVETANEARWVVVTSFPVRWE
jgi:hypothetical protein